jgi:sigma-B regulation protein RsbU (phosphoserine phosphatase)
MIPSAPALLAEVTPEDVGRMIRADLFYLGVGVLLLAAGVAAAALHLRSRGQRRGGSVLPWFALFSFLYGLRLLSRTDTIPLVFATPAAFWRYVSSAITYAIPVPALLLVRAAFPAWRRPLGLVAAVLGAFALGGIATDLLLRRPEAALPLNNVLTIAFMLVATVLIFRGRGGGEDVRTLRIGLASLCVPAMVDNLRGLGLLAWPRSDVEPLGSTVLIACLGTIAVRRVFRDRERLVAIDKELAIAQRIQSSILPDAMPQVRGLAVAARYEPMTAVAGDFYDFLEAGAGRLGVLVADVSGHGVPAALIASMVKVAIAAQRPRADAPAAVLSGMNETLAGRLGGQYVTAAYLFVDLDAGLMRYAAAGHPPLLRWHRGGGAAGAIEENGLPLGMMEASRYTQVEQPLRAGDRFLLYTDGLVDAANAAGEFFGLERVKETVVAAGALDAAGIAGRIVDTTRRWTGGIAADDLTVVVVDCG